MKSNWRNLESKKNNIVWGIICLLVSAGMIVASVFYISSDDSSLAFIFIPLAILFIVGSFYFFKDAVHQKEIAEEQKEIENANYEAIKAYGDLLSQAQTVNPQNDDSSTQRKITFEENLNYLLQNKTNNKNISKSLIDEIKNVIVIRNDMMKMNDEQICSAIKNKLTDSGIDNLVSDECSKLILILYRKCKDTPYFDIRSCELLK